MNKLQTFVRTFIKSITEPAYYHHVLRAKFSFSLKYFLAFMAILAAIHTLNYSFTIKPRFSDYSHQAIQEISASYPNDLVLSLTNNQLYIDGAPDPVYISFPHFLKTLETDQFPYLAILTTSDTLPKDRAFITATSDQIIIRTPDSTRKEIISYSEMELEPSQTYLLTKDMVTDGATYFQTFLDKIITYSPLIVFSALLIALPAAAALSLLFNTLLTWLLAHILNKGLTYKKSYQIGLHTATFAFTATTLQKFLFPTVHLTSLFTIAFFGATLLALYSLPAKKH